MDKQVCELSKNSREAIKFSLREYQGHKFADLRIYVQEDGKAQVPTKKGLAVNPTLWREFKKALEQLEAAMIQDGWIDRADLEVQG
jgi:hypothetical protein